jgi:hypothetical protein
MNAVLASVIEQFRAAQDRGVATLTDQFGVPPPSSNREWVTLCASLGLDNVRSINGVGFDAHGYGVELTFADLTIDFDWGDAGEPDGFDAWRLWNFVRENGLDADCRDSLQIQRWLDEAHRRGELTRDGTLYYAPAHRAWGAGLDNRADHPPPPTGVA